MYDPQAGQYIAALRSDEYRDQKRRIGEKLAEVIKPYAPASLLDAGTGEATTLVPLLLALGDARPRRVVGFDASLPRLDIARGHIRDNGLFATFYQAGLDNTLMQPESFDVVLTYHAIEPNGGNEKKILQELLRVTRKALIMVEPSYEFAHKSARERMDRLGYVRGLPLVLHSLDCNYRCEQWGLDVNPENPAALIVVEKCSPPA